MPKLKCNAVRVPAGQPERRQRALIAAMRGILAGGLFTGDAALAADHSPLPVLALPRQPSENWARFGSATGSLSADGHKLTIEQESSKAILDWKSFDIDRGYAVHFDQPGATAVALNNIGNTGEPSKIFGSLTANGQVYLINQNGFVFGKGSQVNVSALVASSLGISDDTFRRGITKVFGQTGAAALQSSGDAYLRNEDGSYLLDRNQQKIPVRILVEAGANIAGAKSDKGKVSGGNRVILAAPVVENQGTISSREGQTILAASKDKVYLQESGDSDLRGLLVEVGTGGDINNVGKILADRGNASLVGFAVNQDGLVSATSSVKLNGSIRLLAREGGRAVNRNRSLVLDPGTNVRGSGEDREHATVTLGAGSRTLVMPDANKSEKAVDAQTQPKSKIEIDGHRVIVRSGSRVVAPSGQIDLVAKNRVTSGAIDDSRVFLEKGSVVDASGLRDIQLDMSRNVLSVELRNNELRDSPIQREGFLHAKTIRFDARDVDKDGKLPIADVSGAVNRIRRNIDERSTAGGSINVSSDGEAIVKSGATLDVSGGSVAYRSGTITTSQLIGANGRLYDVGTADPGLNYVGIVGKERFEHGYVEGKAGGSLAISGNAVVADGNLKGSTVRGSNQRLAFDSSDPDHWKHLPEMGRLSIHAGNDIVVDHLPAEHEVGETGAFPSVGGRPAPVTILAGSLPGSGFGVVSLESLANVTVTEGTRLELPATGTLNLSGSLVEHQGTIAIPSGTVTLQPAQSDASRYVHLGSKASIDVRGLWVNDALTNRGEAPPPLAIAGGKVTINSRNADLVLDQGSRIDASGGARMDPKGRVTAGAGGDISLTAKGIDPQKVVLGAGLYSYGLSRGGKLSITTSQVTVGQGEPSPGDDPVLALGPEFFRSGGFSSFDLVANRFGLTVLPDTQLTLRMLNRILLPAAAQISSAPNLDAVSTVGTLPDATRKPVSLGLSSIQTGIQLADKALAVGDGARIRAEAGGSVSLKSDTSIFLNGSIEAPAGNIDLAIVPATTPRNGFIPSQGIWLGSSSKLLADGTYIPVPNNRGLKLGTVLDGGRISLSADRGYIVTEKGATIRADGASQQIDVPTALGSVEHKRREVTSEGGRIQLTAAEGMLLDGSLSAKSGGRRSAGGSLSVVLDPLRRRKLPRLDGGALFPDDDPRTDAELPQPRVIHVTNEAEIHAAALQPGQDIPNSHSGHAWLSAAQIAAGGFSSIRLQANRMAGEVPVGKILFHGDVKLSAERQIALDAPQIGWTGVTPDQQQGKVDLDAAYVSLGSSGSRRPGEAAGGGGHLQVQAGGIDLVGGFGLQGFGQADLKSSGDVRARGVREPEFPDQKDFLGTLNAGGDLTISANRIYPSTLSQYTINANAGTVTFARTGGDKAPIFSAGGALTVNAQNIDQLGTLKAPFGQLNLNARERLHLSRGSVTSVSGVGLTVPFGQVQGETDWVFPLDPTGTRVLVFDKLPAKSISLNGKEVDLASGSKISLNGGGNLSAYEWIPGPGGSTDVLNPASKGYRQKFAVLPEFTSLMTPYDPAEFPASGLDVGDRIYLTGGAGLAAGWYTLLPAHYALLPGAYLVTPQSGTTDLAPDQTLMNPDGSVVVAGRYGAAGTDFADSRWTGFVVQPGSIAKTQSEYKLFQANQFFAAKAAKFDQIIPNLPRDAGDLALSAVASLTLSGNVQTVAYGNGVGGKIDIAADRLAVVNRLDEGLEPEPGVVNVLAADLNALNVSSILLGGQRSREIGADRLTVKASAVTVAGGVHLKNKEVILAATEEVKVAGGAVVESKGTDPRDGVVLKVQNADGGSDGALLRVSSGEQAQINRGDPVTGTAGILDIEQGAQLKSSGSILLDSTKDTFLDGEIDMTGGSLALHASEISLGDAPAAASGLVLDQEQLAALRVRDLELVSSSDLNLFGAVRLQLPSAPGGGTPAGSSLSIDAAAIKGYGGAAARLAADHVLLRNGSSKVGSDPASGAGTLDVQAGKQLMLDDGSYRISGFQDVRLHSDGAILATGGAGGQGSGRLAVDADLTLEAKEVSGRSGATAEIDVTGHDLTLASVSGTADASGLQLGAKWSLRADAISGNAHFNLASGILAMQALQGDIHLTDGSRLDVSGEAVAFGRVTRHSDGGSISLQADHGNVVLADRTELALDGKGSGNNASDAGQLIIQAAEGLVDLGGAAIHANSGGGALAGSIALDAQRFGGDGFSELNDTIRAAGFTESVSIRQRSGDIDIAASDQVKAHHLVLSADHGNVAVDGAIDASGADGGSVAIRAGREIRVGASASILAQATESGGNGGHVLLDAVGQDNSETGVLDLSAASAAGKGIDVSAGAGGRQGDIHLRTGRDADGNVGLREVNEKKEVNTRFLGVDQVALEATRVYQAPGNTIDAQTMSQWKQDTDHFMAAVPAVPWAFSVPITVMPGIEVRSSGDLKLAADWDFVNWRYGSGGPDGSGTAGFLTLRAGGDLLLDHSLSDAFAPGKVDPDLPAVPDLLQPGNSWSYQLVSGRDVVLAPNIQVRTGTGTISLKARRDVVFKKERVAPQQEHPFTTGDHAAAVYTMGRPGSGDSDAPAAERRYGNLDDTFVLGSMYAEYPVDGGDITIAAGRDVVREINPDVLPARQLITEWLARTDTWTESGTGIPAMWGINIGGDYVEGDALTIGSRRFYQDVGALGGGNVTVTAGGDVRDLSVMLPTSAKPIGQTTVFNDGRPQEFHSNQYLVQGGGNLNVAAGGDIVGGVFYVEKGYGRLDAGGSIGTGYLGAGRSTDADGSTVYDGSGMGPALAMGAAQFDLHARKDIGLATVFNPSLLEQANLSTVSETKQSLFLTYDGSSSVKLRADSGDVVLQNNYDQFQRATGRSDDDRFALSVYPATVKIEAMQGSIEVQRNFNMVPSNQGQLELLAGTNLLLGSAINMSDADPTLLPSPELPAGSLVGTDTSLQGRLSGSSPKADVIHAAVPVHQQDPARPGTRQDRNPVLLVAASGDIDAASAATLFLPKAAEIVAGRDIRNLDLRSQNLEASDVTRIEAGRDFRYPTSRNAITGALDRQPQSVEVSGPGQLQLVAGRDIDLGSSNGVRTFGGLRNPALSGNPGAGIAVLAGLADKPDLATFIDTFVGSGKYAIAKLDEAGNPVLENGKPLILEGGEAANYLKGLEEPNKLKPLLDILYREVADAANRAARSGRKQDYQSGYDAIAEFFGNDGGKGDLRLFFSQIQTLAGGDIDIAVPGGMVNAGLAGTVSGAKEASQLGLVVQQTGNLSAVVKGDFQVNESRVFTMDGGDILIWSSNADIDAGRGAKSAISAPSPQVVTDPDGNVSTRFPPTVSGSGIQAIVSSPDRKPGKVILAAPAGVVNAGEAGIKGGQVVIAATAVIGASNIQSTGGASIGVATAVAPPVVPAGADSAATGAAKAATGMDPGAEDKATDSDGAGKQAAVSMLSVDVVGYGECSVADVRAGKESCGTGG